MKTDIAQSIRRQEVPAGGVAIFWLGQAGFVFKTTEGRIVYVDPYLTDSTERLVGFKRIMVGIIAPEEVSADIVLITHHHEDHLDVDAIPIIARRTRTRFVSPPQSVTRLLELGLDRTRIDEVRPGDENDHGFLRVVTVFADHGELAPDAVGYVLEFSSIRIYVTGDSAYRPEKMVRAISMKPQVIIPVINGAFGNMGGEEAAFLTRDAGAEVAIPCHYWTFIEHGGNPAAFIQACAQIAPRTRTEIMAQGECFIYPPTEPYRIGGVHSEQRSTS